MIDVSLLIVYFGVFASGVVVGVLLTLFIGWRMDRREPPVLHLDPEIVAEVLVEREALNQLEQKRIQP